MLPDIASGASSSASPRAPGRSRDALDAELREHLAAVAAGDRSAMTRFYDASQRIVFALALRVVGERELAEEVALDTYMQVWRSAASFDPARGQVTTWLLTIARSRALDRRRAVAARALRESAWPDELAESAADGRSHVEPAEVVERADLGRSLRTALESLPPAQRRAVELAFLPGLSHPQIAERLCEPLGTVKTRIRLGLLKLREALKELETDS